MFPYARAVNIRYLAHRPMERLFHRTLVSSGAGMTSTARGELSQSAWFARVDDRRDRKTTKLLGSRVCFFSVSTSSLFCAVCKDNNEILRDSGKRKSIIYSKGKKKIGRGRTRSYAPVFSKICAALTWGRKGWWEGGGGVAFLSRSVPTHRRSIKSRLQLSITSSSAPYWVMESNFVPQQMNFLCVGLSSVCSKTAWKMYFHNENHIHSKILPWANLWTCRSYHPLSLKNGLRASLYSSLCHALALPS